MADHGAPISYMTLAEGTPAYASGGERVGTVHRVLADAESDIFDGLILDTDEGERFADAPRGRRPLRACRVPAAHGRPGSPPPCAR